MKRFFLFTVFLTLISLLVVPVSWAKVVSEDGPVIISSDEVIEDDLFVSGETVLVEGLVKGDLYAAAGTITINGEIEGDVLAAGGVIEISGIVGDDVRVAGGNISIREASIGDGLMTFGGNVDIDEATTVGGSLVFGSGSLISRATVGRGVLGGSGMVTLNGSIGKDVRLGAGSLVLGNEVQIGGDLIYGAEEAVSLPETATVSGKIQHIIPETQDWAVKPDVKSFEGIGKGFKLIYGFGSYFAALIVGLLTVRLFRKPAGEIAEVLEKKFFASLGWGVLVFFLVGPALFLLMITGVGLPLAMILGALFMIEMYLAKIFVGLVLGKWLKKTLNLKSLNAYLSLALGLALFHLLSMVPVGGFFIKAIGSLAALGALLSYKKVRLLKTNGK